MDERLAALICLVGSVMTISWSGPAHYYLDIESGILAVDILALLGFVGVALRSKRFWPLWVAGFQLTSVLSHFIKALHWSLIPQVYAAAERLWIYPILLAIVVGTWRSRRYWRQSGEINATPA
ncbi:MAG: hypothetical protein H0W65_02620 [Sphingomonas sp.]|uniref:hypothetical protein n=1 Tax=Sphingomonas sp. TaxID=28214 RepID=UPI001805B433|nr:hypothetical protein [Sphingomonas sp.]MBA3666602.1 hypothetical protein [Sphingomonas sp.]